MAGNSNKRVVLVLGASSNGGVGCVTARRFAGKGATVAVSARRLESLQALAKEIDGIAVACDIADEQQVKQLASEMKTRFGKIDVIVNAIGHVVSGTPDTTQASHLHEAMATEYFGNFHLFKHLGPLVAEGGAIVVISSLASTHYVPGVLPYANAKAAANNLVKYAAVELAPRRIRVNAIVASLIDTPMIDAIRDNTAIMNTIAKEISLGRGAKASEIAAAAEWLCDPECFMTGALVPVDGGNHLRRAPFPDEMPATTFDALV